MEASIGHLSGSLANFFSHRQGSLYRALWGGTERDGRWLMEQIRNRSHGARGGVGGGGERSSKASYRLFIQSVRKPLSRKRPPSTKREREEEQRGER